MLQDVCQLALTVRCCRYIQKAAYNAFIKLIELFKDQELKLVDTFRKFTGTLPVYKPKGEKKGEKGENALFDLNCVQNVIPFSVAERTLIFCVLGKIIKHNESVRSLWKYLDKIFQCLVSDASTKVKSTVMIQT